MIHADLHMHTIASHGRDTVNQMYAMGSQIGLDYIGFSEHSPLPSGFFCHLYTGDLEKDFPIYVDQVLELKISNVSKPLPLLGMELDWLPTRLDYMRNLISISPFDYILGSLHYLDGYSVGSIRNWQDDVGIEERFARFDAYFCEMASMCQSGLIQCASHPDFIKLRTWEQFQIWLERPQTKNILAYALESMAKHNVAMEVSSAGLRQDFAEPYPCPTIMRLAKELNVTICFGSDAHKTEDIANKFDELKDYASSFDFKESVIFSKRQPIYLPITA